MKIDKKIIKELSDYLDEFNLTEIEYSENNIKYKVSKSSKGLVHEQIVSTANQPRSSSPGSSTVATDNINKANIIKQNPLSQLGLILKKGKQLLLSRP
jgi:acetyl-CoA carboxylase biotin carboxyl carrier protein